VNEDRTEGDSRQDAPVNVSCPDDAEVGWAYQTLHDRDRREVFAAARARGNKIDAAGVVAASRLYTPRYIVDFLLQNSLGVLWSAMYPDDPASDRWPFFVAVRGRPRTPAPLRELRLLDPCCGCGAFLLPAFEMLTDLYARERALATAGRIPRDWSVPADEVARTIVERNLHGADLDDEAVAITTALLRTRAGADVAVNLHVPDLPIGSLATANWPTERFDVVCTNPPYVGFRMLDPAVKQAVRAEDPLARSDLAVAFQSRCFALLADGGLCATVTPAAWMTGRESLPLRTHILSVGGPQIGVALGQRVFGQAPLLFVGLSVVARGVAAEPVHVLRPQTGSGAEGLRAAVADGPVATDRALLERLPLRPFLPGAPPTVLALAGRGPRVGDLFTSFDGVWTGDNARDTRFWWELNGDAEGWRPLSGGQGHEPWAAPTRLRIQREHTAGQQDRAGGIEYARVAGGRLAARVAMPGTASLAGIVTLVPRDDEGTARTEEVLAVFNSRIGAAWLRTLTSGLNFNPGYAAEIPLAPSPPADELRAVVRRLVDLRSALARRDPTSDTFVATRRPWEPCELAPQVDAHEGTLDLLLARHLGIDRSTYARMAAVTRPRRRGTALDDHLLAHVLRALGFRWPNDPSHGFVGSRSLAVPELVGRLGQVLAGEGVRDLGLDLRVWLTRRLPRYHESRFRRRPVLSISATAITLASLTEVDNTVGPG
jgi:Putative RNA methylase family UPF0020